MKRLFTLCAIVMAVAVSSCSKFDDTEIWDKLNDHESRITALEELCKQMNTNIDALQTIVEALEKRDYVTNVSPVRKDGEVIGYTISFADSDTITIYHGENGQDGADGKDGYTPQIGVMKDTDGIYYWTLDGEWLLDGKGNKIQANGVNGIDGTDGSNGEDGTNGVDGITPRLKIENDYWYVSYDEGATWIELGKATGEDGSNGIDGVDGDSIFSSVTQDDEYVYFNLADGTMITLPKHDKENIQFEDLNVKAICCKNWDTNNDGELSYAEAAAVADIGTVFRSNTSIIAFTEFKYFTGLTEIPSYAFCDCESLWKIELPSSIIQIGVSAFQNCESIRYIDIPYQVEVIDKKSFAGCVSINRAKISDSVISINEEAFSGCIGIQEIIFGKNVSTIADRAFEDCCSLSNVIFRDNLLAIGVSAFSGCSSIVELDIPNSVVTIGDWAFSGCTGLTSINIQNGVTEIGTYAFSNCSSLKKISIPHSVTSIGKCAFAGCTGELIINSAVVSNNHTVYGYPSKNSDGWLYNSKFNSIVIGEDIVAIGNYVFYDCHSVDLVTLSNNLISIGDNAFGNCRSMNVYCKATTPPQIRSKTFTSMSVNGSYTYVYVPQASVSIYRSEWSVCESVLIVGYEFE